MRSILIDWLVDVSVHFEVMTETLHFAVTYIDRTLSLIPIEKGKLQLVGVTCMKIADVFNEKSKEYYRQENATEYAYITADEYTPTELIDMEKHILSALHFKLYSPTTVHFIKIYASLLELDSKVNLMSLYLGDLMLLSIGSLNFKPSLIASSVIFVAQKTLEIETAKVDKCRSIFGSWHSIEDFE